jgi:hypothetical protein
MAILTTAQKTYIRSNTGDNGTPPHLDDDYLQYLYDNNAGSDLNKTVYWAIRALIGIASTKVSQSNARTGDSKSEQQWREALENMAKDWGAITGLGASSASVGSINLGIDEEIDSYNIT